MLTLPDSFWRRRARFAPFEFARQTAELAGKGARWDAVFASSMLDLAKFKGLAPPPAALSPTISYFHENQLAYPLRNGGQPDIDMVLANFAAGLAADEIWFNSDFNRRSFLDGLPDFFAANAPDGDFAADITRFERKSRIMPPGIEPPIPRKPRQASEPPLITWAARWEHDKNPEDFFAALRILRTSETNFRIAVMGEKFPRPPRCFANAKKQFADNIIHWGFLENHRDYLQVLSQTDIFVSTANHEFFGLSVMEAAAAGAHPLLPVRLAYPEIFTDDRGAPIPEYFHDGTPQDLAAKLAALIGKMTGNENPWPRQSPSASVIAERYHWSNIAPELDTGITALIRK